MDCDIQLYDADEACNCCETMAISNPRKGKNLIKRKYKSIFRQ